MRTVFLALVAIVFSSIANSQNLAILDAKVYASPDAPPSDGTSILLRDGKIAAIGKHIFIPPGTPKLPCQGCIVFAGFWNCHVHFMEPKWVDAAHLPADQLDSQLSQMVLQSGFTTVVDTGSDTLNTVALRRRIESGEVAGPRIYTAGTPLFPAHALPYYLKDLPPPLLARLGQPATPEEAADFVEHNIAQGADIVKVFTGSIVAPEHIVPMTVPITKSAADAGHKHGQLVFTHPSNLEGTRVAMESGVDVLAHAPEAVEGLDDAFLAQIVAHHMSMIPTLKLFSQDSDIAKIRSEVAKFHHLGGTLLFGTDTGFLTDYDISEEYRQLALAGLSWQDVLAMLTTTPAQRFQISDQKGRIAPGMDGDLTILSADPAQDGTAAFAKVRSTIRNGRILYDKN
jgi:imidazolonepropionase-like amidohydrolase